MYKVILYTVEYKNSELATKTLKQHSLAFILVALDADDGPGIVLVHTRHDGVAVPLLALQRAAADVPGENDKCYILVLCKSSATCVMYLCDR